MKTAAMMLAAAFAFAIAAGCNTIEGIGEDIESIGETVAEEAR